MVRSLLLLSAFHAPLEVVHEPLGVHKPEAGKHGREKSKGYNHQPTGEHVLKCFADQKQADEMGPWELPCDCIYSLYDKKLIFRLWWNIFLLQRSLFLYGKRKKNAHLSCLWKVFRFILETVRGRTWQCSGPTARACSPYEVVTHLEQTWHLSPVWWLITWMVERPALRVSQGAVIFGVHLQLCLGQWNPLLMGWENTDEASEGLHTSGPSTAFPISKRQADNIGTYTSISGRRGNLLVWGKRWKV